MFYYIVRIIDTEPLVLEKDLPRLRLSAENNFITQSSAKDIKQLRSANSLFKAVYKPVFEEFLGGYRLTYIGKNEIY